MVTTGTKHALQCGAFTESWKEWNRTPRANRSWLAWKNHWTRAFEEQRTIQRLTGGEFAAHSATQGQDDALATQMVTSLDNLAMAAVQKNETIEKLIQINEMKEKTITNLMAQLEDERATSTKLLEIIHKAGLQTGKNTNSGSGTHYTNWDPNGYCWTHGYKVKKWHNSKTCKTRNNGHKEGATRANTMGGSQENIGSVNSNLKLNTSLHHLVNSTTTPGCANPPDLNTTALLDTGANISLLHSDAPAQRSPTQLPIKCITQPKGTLVTTETLLLHLTKLPTQARIAHRSPGISNNLLAASDLADAGCELFFHSNGCEVIYNGEIILRGWRDLNTRLWRVSLLHDGSNRIVPPYTDTTDIYDVPENILANSAFHPIYECSNTSQLIHFYYATMGYPVISTWCKAIDKGYFRGWNGLTSDRVRKFIKPSEASEKGHMDQRRANIRSTKSSPVSRTSHENDHMIEHEQTPNNDKTNMVFMTMVEINGQLFTDQTGRFPVTSNRGNNYIVIFYAVDPNYIKSYPIKSRHRSEILKAYDEVYQFLRFRGYRPQLHKLDNETSKDVEAFVTTNNAKFQYTPPDMHRTNTAERAIRTWKNHFIAVRAGTPRTYRLSNWCKDLEQTDITLNMLRPCTTNPRLSAYEAMEGMFSFDKTPMAPIATKVMIHIKPTRRQTWGCHAIRAWYFVPALNHYRCIKAVTESGTVRVSDTFKFLHHTLHEPVLSNMDRIVKATQHLIRTIEEKSNAPPDEMEAIQHLRDLITGAAKRQPKPQPQPKIEFAPNPFEEVGTSNPISDPIHITPDTINTTPPNGIPPQTPNVIPFNDNDWHPCQQTSCKTFGQSGILPMPVHSRSLVTRMAPHRLLPCRGRLRHQNSGTKACETLAERTGNYYECSMDWKGELFCCVQLKWDYKNCTVRISMPHYACKALMKFGHKHPSKPQHS
ncbi:hypothetical protein ACHAW6_004033, partial [Cyclotella cf. meneghiniana]